MVIEIRKGVAGRKINIVIRGGQFKLRHQSPRRTRIRGGRGGPWKWRWAGRSRPCKYAVHVHHAGISRRGARRSALFRGGPGAPVIHPAALLRKQRQSQK